MALEMYKKINENNLEITSTQVKLVEKEKILERKQFLGRKLILIQEELDKINEQLAIFEK